MGSPVFAVRIEILTPDFFHSNESKKLNDVRTSHKLRTRVNANISQKIKEFEQSTARLDLKKPPIALEITEESQQRIRGLLERVKSEDLEGSFIKNKELKRANNLKNLSDELISTERRYFESLRILKDVGEKLNSEHLENADVLRTVFKDIPSLYMLHSYMDVAFAKSQTPVDWLLWLDVFTSKGVANYFNIYKSFLSQCYTTSKQLTAIYAKNKEFQEICVPLVQSSQFPEQHLQDVPGMYIGIQSRLTRCDMLIAKLMETTTDAIGKAKCSAALSIIRNILRATEAEVYKNEKTVMALEINEKLEGRCNQVDQLALFIRSGPVMKVPRRAAGRRHLHRHLFLFSDYLIITEPVSPTGKYLVKSELTVVSMVVEDVSSQDDLQIPCCIRVKAIENVVELSFASDEEKDSWLKTLEDTIEHEQRKRDTFHAATAACLKNSGSPTEKRAAEWVKDEQASMCALCYKTFTVTRRKHHCRACGKIFCDRCSSYRTKVDYLGDSEVRVCEIDFYRLNPHLKPPTAACVDRLTRFSALPPRFAPLQSGYLLWVYRNRSHWTRKKGHLKVEYSTGVIPSNPDQPSDHQVAVHFQNHSPSEQVNLRYSLPQSRKQSSSPFLLNCTPQTPFNFASLGDDDFTIPLPAARLTIAPQLSRVYAILQPNSTLCIYAAKEDAKPKHQLPVLGMRLLYLIQLSAPHESGSQGEGTSSSTSSMHFASQPPNLGSLCDSPGVLQHSSSLFGDDRASLTSTTSSSSTSTSGEADVHTPGALFNRLQRHSCASDVGTLRNPENSLNLKYKNTRPPKRLEEATRLAVAETDNPSTPASSQAPSPTEMEISRLLCQDTVFQLPTVPAEPSVNGHIDRTSSTPQSPCDDMNSAVSNAENDMDTRYVQSHPTPKISDDALSVLTNTRGLLLLPLNNDCIGHYLEAPTETVRNEWIKQIRNSVLNLFDQFNASKPEDS